MKTYDALAMFSGGLDSILAARTVAAQGFSTLCLHFVSPFFGHPDRVDGWREDYGLDIVCVDVGREYVSMMLSGPAHGVGKGLNPCVDCKILMLTRAKAMMAGCGARFLVTGEVKGQRPMSQRRDALDVISRDAGVRDVLLRPLCARNMKPTPMEESGLVDRSRLHDFGGRTRTPQLKLARAMGIAKIPQPAGGCRLTERESAKRYLPVFLQAAPPAPGEFALANVGRQFWSGPLWLTMGRKRQDNQELCGLACPDDLFLDLQDFPSPLGLVRPLPGAVWDEAAVLDAAALLASYSPKAVAAGGEVAVQVWRAGDAPGFMVDRDAPPSSARVVTVLPRRESALGLAEPDWEAQKPLKRELFGEEQEDDGY